MLHRYYLLLCLLVAMPARAFDYGGLSLETEARRLRELFPASVHEFWQRATGSVLLPEDAEGRFDEALREGDGRYVVRLAPEDTRAEVTSLALTLERGRTVRVTLGLDRDSKGFTPESIERRFPGCRGVLDALVARYGQPSGFQSRTEEGLERRLRTWKGPQGLMRLECGRFPNREAIFAIDVEIDAAEGVPPSLDQPAPARGAASQKPPGLKSSDELAAPAHSARTALREAATPKAAPATKPLVAPPKASAAVKPGSKGHRNAKP
ncbi:MAG: hypothetical protein ACK53H_09210 [Betaproteobacteria bacterium]